MGVAEGGTRRMLWGIFGGGSVLEGGGQRSAKRGAGALCFLETQQLRGLRGAWGASVVSLLWGWVHSVPREGAARAGKAVCCGLGWVWLGRAGTGDAGRGGKAWYRRQLLQPRGWVFILGSSPRAQSSSGAKAPSHFSQSFPKTPGRELNSFSFTPRFGREINGSLGPLTGEAAPCGVSLPPWRGGSGATCVLLPRARAELGAHEQPGCNLCFLAGSCASHPSSEGRRDAPTPRVLPSLGGFCQGAPKAQAGQNTSCPCSSPGARCLGAFPEQKQPPGPGAAWQGPDVHGSDVVQLPICPSKRKTPGQGGRNCF